ncbi:uncharacterized protein LOC122662909 [Telopea speciosissima]|uniref:uncharacterized protein LOC122662909 n=1 Tax=Telopea speciosissima TaxID=54955 RepID=UPI001CC51FCF|nr:uncharacterized protein LOC122662909 [Telopea speciosissima]
MAFDSVDQYRTHLKNYAIQEGFEIHRLKNERTRVTIICANGGCPWRIHVSPAADGKTFIVKSYTDRHTCSGRKTKIAAANSRWAASKLAPHIKANPSMTIKSIHAMMRVQCGLKPSNQQLYRARMMAKEDIEGNHVKSFAQLLAYLELVDQYNPVTVIKIEFVERQDMNENPMFKRLFVCFKACIKGFLQGCKPFIGLWGNFLAATTSDGDNDLFPVAFGVVEVERKDSWMWFLVCLYIALQSEVDYVPHSTFMPDKQKVTKCIFLNLCNIEIYLWVAAKAYTLADLQKAMVEMKDISVDAHDWLMKNPPSRWSRHAFDQGAKIDHVTNNMTESFNQWIAPYRDKPIVNLIDQLKVQLMTRFQKRYASACTFKGTITPAVRKRLDSIERAAWGYTGYAAGLYEFEVNDKDHTVVVKLADRTCIV